MSFLTNKAFWIASLERAVKTFAQALVALFLADTTLNVLSVNWEAALSVAVTAALISFLTSLGSGYVSPQDSPSLVAAPPATPPGTS